MTGRVTEVLDVVSPDKIATKISEDWITWNNQRAHKMQDWEEIRRYVYATDTSQTSNSSLPWKNKTTVPKLCQIRDNLYANYVATLFPKRKWLTWEANSEDSEDMGKRDAIINYMAWAIEQPGFKTEMDKIILDYVDFGNCFATVEWIDRGVEQPDKTQVGYVGPAIRRISPLDIVMNPTSEEFISAPKFVRSLISMGELKKLLSSMSTDDNY